MIEIKPFISKKYAIDWFGKTWWTSYFERITENRLGEKNDNEKMKKHYMQIKMMISFYGWMDDIYRHHKFALPY